MSTSTTALALAVKWLSQREHSQQEIRQKLTARHCCQEDIDTTVQYLISKALLSDTRFADMYVRSVGWRFGDRRLRFELQRRGIAPEEVGAALNSDTLVAEKERALTILEKKYPTGISATEKAKAYRFLQARGFAQETIMSVLATHSRNETLA